MDEIESPILRLEDHWGEYLVDLQLLEWKEVTLPSEGIYLGRFDGRTGPLEFIPAEQGQEEVIDKVQ